MIELPGWPISDARETALLQEVLASPQWGGFNPLVASFEDAFAAYQGARFGVSAVNGGRDAFCSRMQVGIHRAA